MSSINFDNPYLLLLAIPVAALFIVPFAIAVRKDNINGHNIASGIIHIIMALIIGFVAAGTSIVTTVTQTDVYVVADVSYSANRNLDVIDGYISDLSKNLPDNSRMGVVCFGRDYKLTTRLGGNISSVKSADVDDSATDIIGALDFTGSLFRDGVIKRIVLITDGKQTNNTDANALKRQVDALADKKIHVDAIFVDDNLGEGANEVQLTDVNFTQRVSLNKKERPAVLIECKSADSREVDVSLKLSAVSKDSTGGEESRQTLREETFTLVNGKNTVTIGYDLPTSEAGVFDYEINIVECFYSDDKKAFDDANDRNNVLKFTQEVTGEMKVLLIYSNERDTRAISDIYGDKAEIEYRYYSDSNMPCSVDALCKFDEIVISDVNLYSEEFAGGTNNNDTFLRSLNTVVESFGKSLVTFGNTYIQNYGQGQLKALSDMLPVKYGKSDSEPKLYTILFDTSRSMEYFVGNLDRAKRAAIEVVEMLDDQDFVSVIQFNSSPSGVENTPIRLSEGRQAVIDAIDSFDPKIGTNIGAGLQYAVPIATGGNYSERRLMLFSDGIDWGGSGADSVVGSTVESLLDRGVVTSVLDLGRGARDDKLATDAKALLKSAARLGGGSYLDISTDANLKDVIDNELPDEVNKSDGNISQVYVKKRTDEVLKGVDIAALTSTDTFVDNFVYSRARGTAETVLTVDFIANSGKSMEAPLYAYRRLGNGRTASFTSALSGEWIAAFSPELRKQLFGGILNTNVPEEKINEPFKVNIEKFDGFAEISLVPARMQINAKTSVTVTAPDGSKFQSALTNNATEFTHTFLTPYEGKYVVEITYDYGEAYTVTRAVNVSYSSEYDSFALYDAGVLHRAIGANGKVSEDGKLSIVNDENEVGVYDLSLTMPLMIACVVLFAVDVGVRKLKWEDIKSFFKRSRKVKK